MEHYFVKGDTLPEAYHKALVCLAENGKVVPCPDYSTATKECSMTFHVASATKEPRISRCFIGGHHELQQYVMEVQDGILDFMIGHGWDYTYHNRIAKQLPLVVETLRRDRYSRRAVIDVRDNEADTKSEHPACLQHMQFTVRNGAVDLYVVMRSNDAPEATFMNAFAFIKLQEKVAEQLGLEVGGYTHTANSFHAYKKDWKLLDDYVKRIKLGLDTTYNYETEYNPLMLDEIPAIREMVADLQEKTCRGEEDGRR